jgi:hypothetical protein
MYVDWVRVYGAAPTVTPALRIGAAPTMPPTMFHGTMEHRAPQ